ncbi:hypothetical protein ACFVAF_39365 [Streptomyces sp. NPDC057596]|uniref:hypothetical protein n=1 Tax=unclassified Streptomyces TaxID=2593676 RepID=UPI00343DA8F1
MPNEDPEETPAAHGRRVPLRFINDRGLPTVHTNAERTEHSEADPEEWASLPAEAADHWDATCWFPANSVGEVGRPEMYPIPLRPGGAQ